VDNGTPRWHQPKVTEQLLYFIAMQRMVGMKGIKGGGTTPWVIMALPKMNGSWGWGTKPRVIVLLLHSDYFFWVASKMTFEILKFRLHYRRVPFFPIMPCSLVPISTKVFVNGVWVGIHREPQTLIQTLRHLRRQVDVNNEVGALGAKILLEGDLSCL
jgi:hypothetical protein